MTANTMTAATATYPTPCPLCSATVDARALILTGMWGPMCPACWSSYRHYQDRNLDENLIWRGTRYAD